MKLLSPTIHIGSGASRFEYRAVLRKGMHAVYSQSQFGRVVAYEAMRIQSHNGFTVTDKKIGKETEIPAAESMPSASAWGVHGFTLPTKEAAVRKMAAMMVKGGV